MAAPSKARLTELLGAPLADAGRAELSLGVQSVPTWLAEEVGRRGSREHLAAYLDELRLPADDALEEGRALVQPLVGWVLRGLPANAAHGQGLLQCLNERGLLSSRQRNSLCFSDALLDCQFSANPHLAACLLDIAGADRAYLARLRDYVGRLHVARHLGRASQCDICLEILAWLEDLAPPE